MAALTSLGLVWSTTTTKKGLGLTGPGWPEKQKIFFHLGQLGPAWAVLVWGGPVPVLCLSWAGQGQPGPASH